MHRRTLSVVAVVALACAPATHAGTSPGGLSLIVDTTLKTFTFEGSVSAEAQPFGSSFAVRWEFTPPGGPDVTGSPGSRGLTSFISLSQENAAPLGAFDLQFVPNGATPDLMRLDARWLSDPGLVTFTGAFPTGSYAILGADAQAIFERSIGSVLPGSSVSPDAPGIPIIGIPAPGVLALFGVTGVCTRRRRR